MKRRNTHTLSPLSSLLSQQNIPYSRPRMASHISSVPITPSLARARSLLISSRLRLTSIARSTYDTGSRPIPHAGLRRQVISAEIWRHLPCKMSAKPSKTTKTSQPCTTPSYTINNDVNWCKTYQLPPHGPPPRALHIQPSTYAPLPAPCGARGSRGACRPGARSGRNGGGI